MKVGEILSQDVIIVKKKSQARVIWNRFTKNKVAVIGLVILCAVIIFTYGANLFFSYEDAIKQNLSIKLNKPSFAHPFGTDYYGRDLLTRVAFGGRISISVSVAVTFLTLAVSLIIGAASAYWGGIIDSINMRVSDMFMAIPPILMAITIVAVLGPNLFNLLLALAISSIPSTVRMVRSLILTIKNNEYIEAAHACGTSNIMIIFKHLIPNIMGVTIVSATLGLAGIILSISALGFLGLGAQPPTPEWGLILSEGRGQIRYNPYLVFFPGMATVITVLALNLVGDGLRDALDPRMKN